MLIPNNPNSSPITAKMKSVSDSGRKYKFAWVPSPKPFPKNPPDPIAILDCAIFQPEPNGSDSGFKRVAILCFWNGARKLFQRNGKDRIKTPNEIPINLQFNPAKNKINKPDNKIKVAVPKSGCSETSIKHAKIINTGIRVDLKLIGKDLWTKYAERNTGRNILQNSEGCIVVTPRSIQRFAPFIVGPKKIAIIIKAMVTKNAPLAYEKYTWGSGWLISIINPRPMTTNADCLRKIERSPWEALYKKNSPKVDKKKIEKNK